MLSNNNVKYILSCLSAAMLFMSSCSNANNRDMVTTSDMELRRLDSLSDGYLSYVIENAVNNHVRTYLGFEESLCFFDSIFLCDYPEYIKDFFVTNEKYFTFALDIEDSEIEVYFKGLPYLTVDVSRYNCNNLSCLYRNKVLLYDSNGAILMDDVVAARVKLGLKREESYFRGKGYLSDSILDVDLSYPKNLFCDFDCSKGPNFRCFFDTVTVSGNDYLLRIVDSLQFYCNHYGLSRIISSVVILHPSPKSPI